jgi:urease accessory protein
MKHLLYQLADSAFPAGSFAHSSGLEAARAHGWLRDERDLVVRLTELAWHVAHAVLPFLGEAYRDPVAADRACDRFLTSHVANRASRAQGRALELAAREMFAGNTGVATPDGIAASEGRHTVELPYAHQPVVLGAICASRVPLDDARELAMFAALRSAMSSAVRLGVVGPLRAQRLLFEVGPIARAALAETRDLPITDAASTAPLVDLAQAGHDRLYTRLFQS